MKRSHRSSTEGAARRFEAHASVARCHADERSAGIADDDLEFLRLKRTQTCGDLTIPPPLACDAVLDRVLDERLHD